MQEASLKLQSSSLFVQQDLLHSSKQEMAMTGLPATNSTIITIDKQEGIDAYCTACGHILPLVAVLARAR